MTAPAARTRPPRSATPTTTAPSVPVCGFRDYNPLTARWLNRDLIEKRCGLNWYAFVGNDGDGRCGVADRESKHLRNFESLKDKFTGNRGVFFFRSKILLKITLVLVIHFCAGLHLHAEDEVKTEFDARIARLHDRITHHERLLMSTEWELMKDYLFLLALKDLFGEIREFQEILRNSSISALLDIDFRSQRQKSDMGVLLIKELDGVASVLSGFSSQLTCSNDNAAKLKLARRCIEDIEAVLKNKIHCKSFVKK